MTPEEAKSVAQYVRRSLASELVSDHFVRLALEAADIIESAAEPAMQAAAEPRCGNCRFWASIKGGQGECRRMPPMQFFSMQRRHQDTRDTHWCGEFSPRG